MERRRISSWIHTALAVAQSGSPARGARQLGVSITTAYRHINALERSLGVQIFNRKHTGWTLRDELRVLVSAGEEIERVLRRAENEMRSAAGRGHQTLRIALSDDIAEHYVAPRLRAFCDAHENIQPDLIVSSEFADLASGEADVAIRPDMDPGDTLVGRRVGYITHALYASNAYVRAHGTPASLAALSDHGICGYGPALRHYTAAEWLDAHVSAEAIVARFSHTFTMARAVEEGLGVGLLPCFVGDALACVEPVMVIEGALPVDIWLVAAAASRKWPKVRAFNRFFAARMRADEALFIGRPYG